MQASCRLQAESNSRLEACITKETQKRLRPHWHWGDQMTSAPKANIESTVGNGAEPDGTLLGNCPFCDYPLEGLPIEHTCPECGQSFDRRWVVFGGIRNRRRLWAWLKRLTLGLLTLWMIATVLAREPGLSVLLLLFSLQTLLFAAIGLRMVLGNGSFAVVESEGLLVGDPRSRKAVRHKWPYVHTMPFLFCPLPVAWLPRCVLVNNLPLWRIGILNHIPCARAVEAQKRQSSTGLVHG
jgi:hypothetical protein